MRDAEIDAHPKRAGLKAPERQHNPGFARPISMSMASGINFALVWIAKKHMQPIPVSIKGDGMKSVQWIVAMMAITMVVACGQQDTVTSAKEEVESSASDIKQASKNMVAAIQDYSMEQKEVLQKQVQNQIDNLSDKINHLQNQSENATDETKSAINEATADLNQKLDTAKAKVRQLQTATSDTWENVKGDLSAAMQDVEDAYNKAASRLQ